MKLSGVLCPSLLLLLAGMLLAGCGSPAPETTAQGLAPTLAPGNSPANSSSFITLPDTTIGPRSAVAGTARAAGSPIPPIGTPRPTEVETSTSRERRREVEFEEVDPVEEARRKREEVWLEMAKLAEPQWKLEGEKLHLELALHNDPSSANREEIQQQIDRLEERLQPLRITTAQYQQEVDQYNMTIRASRW